MDIHFVLGLILAGTLVISATVSSRADLPVQAGQTSACERRISQPPTLALFMKKKGHWPPSLFGVFIPAVPSVKCYSAAIIFLIGLIGFKSAGGLDAPWSIVIALLLVCTVSTRLCEILHFWSSQIFLFLVL